MSITAQTVFCYVLMLCRIGGCLMFMPGFSSPRVPQQVRMLMAIGGTLALAPVLLPTVSAALAKVDEAGAMQLILSEVTVGALIGVMGRFFYMALEFMGTAIASSIGFSNIPGTPIEHTDPIPAIASVITITATVLFFILDLHWEVIRGLVESYKAMPIERAFATDFSLAQIGDALSDSFVLTLQISSPFIVYAIAINFLFGIAGKLTPQIAIYFVSVPFAMAGGLLLLYLIISDFMKLFMAGFMNWLTNG
jgi:flagellar biosynthetic protein FliR